MRNKKGVVTFDVDNTLVGILPKGHEYIWSLINEQGGDRQNFDDAFYKEYKIGGLTYPSWVRLNFQVYKKNGLTKDKLEQIFKEHTFVHPETHEVLEALGRTHHLGIISGGLSNVLEHHGILKYFNRELVHINSIAFAEDGTIDEVFSTATPYGDKRKYDAYKLILKTAQADPNKSAHIGDGSNELVIMSRIKMNQQGIPFSFNGSEKLQGVTLGHHQGNLDRNFYCAFRTTYIDYQQKIKSSQQIQPASPLFFQKLRNFFKSSPPKAQRYYPLAQSSGLHPHYPISSSVGY